jgi:YNFM family putative membrane transporter
VVAAERRAVAAVAIAAVAVFADMYLTQPLLPELSREYGVSPAVAGTSVSSVVLAIALASSAYGPLGDFLGRKRTMVAGSALLALSTLACAFAPSFPALVVLRAVQGVLVPAVSAVAVAYLGDLRGGRDPGALVGIYIGATVAGGLIGRVGSGLLAERFTWRGSFVAFALATLVATAALALFLRSPRPRPARDIGAAFADSYRAMGRHLSDLRLLGAFFVGATMFFGFIGLFTYLPYLLTSPPFSLDTGTVAWFYASYLAGVLTAPVAGRLSRTVSRRVLVAAGFAIALVGLALSAIASLWAIVAGTLVMNVGMFTAQAVAPAFVNVIAERAKGGANALYQAFYYVGAVFGSTLPGIAWERAAWPGVLWTCGTSLVLGLVAGWCSMREEPRAAALAARP